MATITETVGRLIKEARKAEGLTQRELGEKMGLSESTVNKYEAGKQNLSLETIERVAKALQSKLEINFKK